jgi:hypothetical protein
MATMVSCNHRAMRMTESVNWRGARLSICLVLLAGLIAPLPAALAEQVAVCVYGATPGGIAAAIAAAESGEKVLLIEPTSRIGGLTTSGLSHTDFRTFEGLNGGFLKFSRRVLDHYRRECGADSPQVKDSFQGTHGEPKVNLLVFEKWLAEHDGIKVRTRCTLRDVTVASAKRGEGHDTMRRIESIRIVNAAGEVERIAARVFIDGTYEGGLMAAASVEYRVGREGRDEYGESLAPEQGDGQLQAYNFRLIMTRDPVNRVALSKPDGYRRELFAGVLPLLAEGRIEHVFDYPSRCIYKAHLPALPNGKHDINDVSAGIIRLSLPGDNLAWPDGDAAARRRVFDEHRLWNVGLLYFLQNDAEVPAKFRDEARQWGLCRDEFTDTDHLPPQLYVREARRMVGKRVYREQDCDHAAGDARSVLHTDAIAMGDYGPNCHGTAHEGTRFGGKHTGEFYKGVPPYQIPYDVLVPEDVDNLLVPVAASATHVAFCALRLEPIWMSLGNAAGHAAHLANSKQLPVQNVPIPALQRRLHSSGAATIYFSDVSPQDADFAAVQWWGTAGGFHGLAPRPDKPGQRGKRITSQYFEAYPHHAAELEKPLDADLEARWQELARDIGLDLSQWRTNDRPTRGDFVRAAWRAAKK